VKINIEDFTPSPKKKEIEPVVALLALFIWPIIFVAFWLYGTLAGGFCCYHFVNWFAVPLFGITPFDFTHGVYLMSFVSFFTAPIVMSCKKADDKEDAWKATLLGFLFTYWILLGAGYLTHIVFILK
jgi:hypothetical protein